MKQSVSVTIRRSQIKFAPYNPREDDEKFVKQLLRNFKKVGFMGGIQWNEVTGHLVGGHKRVLAHDLYHKYDGTKDYDIKVERVWLDEKTEKEQNIFLNKAQGKFNREMLYSLLTEIDPLSAGYTQDEVSTLMAMTATSTVSSADVPDIPVLDIDAIERVRSAKAEQTNRAIQRQVDANKFIIIKFNSAEDKAYFCEEYGMSFDEQSIDAEEFMNKLDK